MLGLQDFFALCIGDWSIERTYHYLPEGRTERSHTNYHIEALSAAGRTKVLTDNAQPETTTADGGFFLAFDTTSETGQKVAMALNILFIPQQEHGIITEGLYLRDRAYEEDRPITSHFRYDPDPQELVMTTPYRQTISVDTITFLNPNLRLRRIINFQNNAGQRGEPFLVGFGIEQRV
jgi:CpeS-like protein